MAKQVLLCSWCGFLFLQLYRPIVFRFPGVPLQRMSVRRDPRGRGDIAKGNWRMLWMVCVCMHISMNETAWPLGRVPPSSQTILNPDAEGHSKGVLVIQDITSLVTVVAMTDKRSTSSSLSIRVASRQNDPEKEAPERIWCLAKNGT